jgi:hypothetical protein
MLPDPVRRGWNLPAGVQHLSPDPRALMEPTAGRQLAEVVARAGLAVALVVYLCLALAAPRFMADVIDAVLSFANNDWR